ncbi:HNH endonuclease signature motif containing protein [Agreia sp. Leaf335]|uniref:HNH endonuclease signature motif containing protein n=1 Tax=Agreia sp. Leaf335 TaxID=1736340 RepID=UPI0009E9A926|nr:HNH endonuclease signature motif containing protein [Agreia sp. Leaf335]
MSPITPLLEPDPYVVALEEVAALDRQIAALSAVRAERVTDARNHLHRQAPSDRSTGGPVWSTARVERVELVTELAQLTRRTEYRTATLVDTSVALVDLLPATLAAVAAGALSWEHAEVIAKHSDGLEGDALTAYDARLAALAAEVNPKQLDRKARAQVELSQPSTAVERAEKAAATRRIYVDPGADGMAYLTLFAPAPEIHAIADRAARLAAGLRADGDPRSMGHLKLDVLCDLMLNGETSIPGATRGVRGRVHVMVPAMTLLGVGEEAAILRGYGPIDPATAAQLTAEATSWRRILTDPITGRILTADPRDYRPTARMIDHARLVHPTCVFPGCTVPSERSDIDHTEDHAFGGHTTPENLAPLSQGHHKVKHHTRWQIVQNGDDTLTATSPAGYEYAVRPEGRMQPAPRALIDAAASNASEAIDPTSGTAQTSEPKDDLADCPF